MSYQGIPGLYPAPSIYPTVGQPMNVNAGQPISNTQQYRNNPQSSASSENLLGLSHQSPHIPVPSSENPFTQLYGNEKKSSLLFLDQLQGTGLGTHLQLIQIDANGQATGFNLNVMPTGCLLLGLFRLAQHLPLCIHQLVTDPPPQR